MDITKIKYWTKAIKGENVEHVKIGYSDGDADNILHQYGVTAVALPSFYDAFNNLPIYVTKMCGLDEVLKTGIFVRDVSIDYSEDKDGNNTSRYTLFSTLKAGHANAVLVVSVQHKFIPEGFEDAINTLIDEAEKYIDGERQEEAQTDLFEDTEEVISEGEVKEMMSDTESFPQGELALEDKKICDSECPADQHCGDCEKNPN